MISFRPLLTAKKKTTEPRMQSLFKKTNASTPRDRETQRHMQQQSPLEDELHQCLESGWCGMVLRSASANQQAASMLENKL